MELDVGVVAPNIRSGDGQGRIILEIARSIHDQGHRVTAYSWTCPEELTERDGFEWVPLPRYPGPDLGGIFTFPMIATRALRDKPHSVVCTMGPCALPRQPVVYYAPFTQIGWRREWETAGDPSLALRIASSASSWVESRAVPRAQSVVGMSRRILEELSPLIDGRASRAVAPGGVALEEFPMVTQERRRSARERLGLGESFTVAIVGEYSTGRKGHEILARSLDQDDVMLVKGSGTRAARDRMASLLGSESSLKIVDQASDPSVQDVLAAADAVAIPSLYEPFSLVALEGAASGLPIVISRTAGAADVLGDASILIEPQPSELREALRTVKQNPSMARDLGARARLVAEAHTWGEVSLRVVEQVLGVAARANA